VRGLLLAFKALFEMFTALELENLLPGTILKALLVKATLRSSKF
jgi:hypothetical protein